MEALRDSILFKVKLYAPQSLIEAYHLVSNFKRHNRALGPSHFGKRALQTSSQGQFFQLSKIAKTSNEGSSNIKPPIISEKEWEEYQKKGCVLVAILGVALFVIGA